MRPVSFPRSSRLLPSLALALAAEGSRIRGRHLFAFDLVATAVSSYLALYILAGPIWDSAAMAAALPVVAVLLLVRPLVNVRFGLYRRVWHYATIVELIQIAIATFIGSIVAMAATLVLMVTTGLTGPEALPPSFWLSEWVINLALVGGIRFAIRASSEWQIHRSTDGSDPSRVPTLLFGAGDAGAMVARSAMREVRAGIRPVGFLDDDPSRIGQTVVGLRIFGGVSHLPSAMAATGARRLLITMPLATGSAIRRAMDAGLAAGLEVRTVPPVYELLDGTIDAYRTRRLRVEDLLRRPPSTEHALAVSGLIEDRTIMVTGAGGSIGSELARQVYALRPRRIVLVDRAESPLYTIQRELEVRRMRAGHDGVIETHLANVVSRDLMAKIVADCRPDVIFHAAAYKHVPMMEEHPSEGVQVNIGGTRSILDAAIEVGVPRFVFVSSDKAVHPSSLMGATKRLAESLVADAARRTGKPYVSVRFGNVLASAGSVVPIFLGQLERGEALTVTHPEMTRYFMTIPEAGWLILDAAALGRSGDLFVLDMGEPVRILDLAHDIVRLIGRSADSVSIEFTGLRPGEKLHEELFYANEVIEETDVPKVLRTAAPPPPEDIRARIDGLMAWATSRTDGVLRDAAFQLVTELAGTAAPVEHPQLEAIPLGEVPLIRSLLPEPSLPPRVPS